MSFLGRTPSIRERRRKPCPSSNDSLVFLTTVRGTLVPKSAEAACRLHNGNSRLAPMALQRGVPWGDPKPQGCISPMHQASVPRRESFCFSTGGRAPRASARFFSDPRVHGMASKLFTERDGSRMDAGAGGAFGFDLQAPAARALSVISGSCAAPSASAGARKGRLPQGAQGQAPPACAAAGAKQTTSSSLKVPMPGAPAQLEDSPASAFQAGLRRHTGPSPMLAELRESLHRPSRCARCGNRLQAVFGRSGSQPPPAKAAHHEEHAAAIA